MFLLLLFFACRDQEWQPKEHSGPLLHLVALQAAAAATAAVLPVPGRTQSADRQWQHAISRRPQGTRHAVQVQYFFFLIDVYCGSVFHPDISAVSKDHLMPPT